MWTKKRTIFDGRVVADDWTILRNGQEVGRVNPVHSGAASMIRWVTWVHPARSSIVETQEAALDALREAIRADWPDAPGVLRLG